MQRITIYMTALFWIATPLLGVALVLDFSSGARMLAWLVAASAFYLAWHTYRVPSRWDSRALYVVCVCLAMNVLATVS